MSRTHELTYNETITAFHELIHAKSVIAMQSGSDFRKSLVWDGKNQRFIVEAKTDGEFETHYIGPTLRDAVDAYNEIRKP